MSEWQKRLRLGAAMMAVVAAAISSPGNVLQAQTVDTQSLSSESTSQREVDIEADELQVLDDQQRAVFTGNVDAQRGEVRLNTDKLVVHYSEEPQSDGSKKTKATHLDANGNVVIVTKGQRITGEWAKMDIKANKLTVGGNVVVRQGQTVVRGKKLFVDLDTNKSQMTGGRVKGSFVPGQ
jgi:lipopolysaccharide export system protein LptA